jgi:hypothetical protein
MRRLEQVLRLPGGNGDERGYAEESSFSRSQEERLRKRDALACHTPPPHTSYRLDTAVILTPLSLSFSSLSLNAHSSVAMQPSQREAPLLQPSSLLSSAKSGAPKPPPIAAARLPSDTIDKSMFFRSSGKTDSSVEDDSSKAASNWVPKTLRPVPAYYPLEKSSRLIEDSPPAEIASRLSECLRTLSVHAVYDNDTAHLLSSENVEMHLSLWKTPMGTTPGVVVELQRRKGDSIAFHRYSRAILDAAIGDIPGATLPDDVLYSKRVQRLLSAELSKNQDLEEHENAIIAIEIAHDLIMKDRMDARQLGLESLCLLTDPRKTGYMTAVLTSHVILLGSTQGVEIPGVVKQEGAVLDESLFQEIRETILGLVQFSRIGEDEHQEDIVTPESEHMTVLHNLALAVLANALDVVENPDVFDDEPEDTKPRARLRTASSNDVANEFLQQTEGLSNKEMLSTLISELGKAHVKPHNATLSAKCLGSLLRASDEAKRRAKELDAKTVVSAALEVGAKTHLKLETECKKVVLALQQPLPEQDPPRPPRRRDNNDEEDDEAQDA